MKKLLSSQRVGAVAVSDKAEAFRELLEVAESHVHGHDAGARTTIVRNLVARDGAFRGIHDEPDIGLKAADLDIGLIRGKGIAGTIIVVINERLYADGGGLAVVGDLLVGNGYAVESLHGLGGFAQREA